MEPQPRRDVELQIRVMHPMQPPKERHGMEHHVLAVDRQIEQKHCPGDCEPGGERDNVEEAPAFGLSQEGHPHPRNREHQAHNKRVQYQETEVIRPTEEAPEELWPAWR